MRITFSSGMNLGELEGKKMFDWLRNRQSPKRAADRLYEATVDRARARSFYADCAIPDTLEGRYEMLVLHLFIVLERLHHDTPDTNHLARALTERFVTDMDDCMREIGVGDLTVPKKVKRAAAGLLERVRDYRRALASDAADALPERLAFHALSGSLTEAGEVVDRDGVASTLADYVRRSVERLRAQSRDELLSSGPRFADLPTVINPLVR